MDSATITSLVSGAITTLGGIYGGVRYGKQSALQDAANSSTISANTVEMLQAQINQLQLVVSEQSSTIVDQTTRITVLEGLVTQKAAVSEVHADVRLIKEKLGVL